MTKYQAYLDLIDSQAPQLGQILQQWASINSGTHNLPGLAELAKHLASQFSQLGGDQQWLDLSPAESIDSRGQTVIVPLGKALVQRKRPQALKRVLLAI